ncbi:protein obstructor-E-like isoform X2 [Zophobas morio]|uniref:protein obstructor-E-like isoform X2 n=1 Tax=Zophobas morio TaxID=2755281 RepID=UPI003083B02E
MKFFLVAFCILGYGSASVLQGYPPSCQRYGINYDSYTCPDDFKFNEKIQACDFPQNVNQECNKPKAIDETSFSVTTTPQYVPTPPVSEILLNDPECANVQLDYHPHPFDCSKFTLCYNSKKWYLDCPENFHFDKNSQMCINQESSRCFVDPRCTQDIDFLPHPTDCASYVECYFNISYVQICPDGLWFNSFQKKCTGPKYANCAVTVPPWASTQFRCPGYRKTEPSTYGCKFYIHCDQYQGTLKICPDGMAYHENNQLCSVANLQRCQNYKHTAVAWTTPPPEATVPLSYNFPGCGSRKTYLKHPISKSKFIECVNNLAFERNCPEGLHFIDRDNPYEGSCSE